MPHIEGSFSEALSQVELLRIYRQQIDVISKAPQLYYNWAMPLAFLSIVVAIAALMAL